MTGTQPSNGLRISYAFHSDYELYIYEYASLCVVYAHPGVHVRDSVFVSQIFSTEVTRLCI